MDEDTLLLIRLCAYFPLCIFLRLSLRFLSGRLPGGSLCFLDSSRQLHHSIALRGKVKTYPGISCRFLGVFGEFLPSHGAR